MFNFFKKKKKEGEEGSVEENTGEEKNEKAVPEAPAVGGSAPGGAGLERLKVDLDKVKSGVEALQEVRKSFSDNFARISEQIGELRSMIMDRDKSIQQIELKATKAHDLVDSVHPEKIKTDVQRSDAKIEALKANLEGNESIMGKVMEELKEVKKKIKFFRGVDEVIKLSEEVKTELIEIKKTESKINIDTDKVNTIYAEMREKYKVVDTVDGTIQELREISEQNQKDVNSIKDKLTGLAKKQDVENLVNKVQRYIDALRDLKKKSSMSKDIDKLRTMLDSFK